MANKKNTKPHQTGPPSVSPEKGIELLKAQIVAGEELLAKRPITSDQSNGWALVTKNCLEKAFGVDSDNVNSVMSARRFPLLSGMESQAQIANDRANNLKTQVSRLGDLVKVLEIEKTQAPTQPAQEAKHTGHKVFLVHGHDEAVLHATARFLAQIEQDVVVLREQPNQGHTIIEKFEKHADVAFAVVLLTADDRGGKCVDGYEVQKPRARQNVIFELGYFIGRIGRARVCALYEPGVETPSDYTGVVFIPWDVAGAWKFQLAKEVKAAGLPVDMNKAV